MLSCIFFFFLKFAKGLDRTVLSGSCGPTPILTVHGINKKIGFFILKKLIFISVPDFHGPTFRSGPVLKTMDISWKMWTPNVHTLWDNQLMSWDWAGLSYDWEKRYLFKSSLDRAQAWFWKPKLTLKMVKAQHFQILKNHTKYIFIPCKLVLFFSLIFHRIKFLE